MRTTGNASAWISRYRYSCEMLRSAAASETVYVGAPSARLRIARSNAADRIADRTSGLPWIWSLSLLTLSVLSSAAHCCS
ncbi:hypothetical protein ACFPM0_27760 [Pseudonocardia sulfidoxydans]|uniref:hypothetical protein n=1 Tax=Pseudonocardia sulfidoxydans TaxID=54011 RepID=UPI003618D077